MNNGYSIDTLKEDGKKLAEMFLWISNNMEKLQADEDMMKLCSHWKLRFPLMLFEANENDVLLQTVFPDNEIDKWFDDIEVYIDDCFSILSVKVDIYEPRKWNNMGGYEIFFRVYRVRPSN